MAVQTVGKTTYTETRYCHCDGTKDYYPAVGIGGFFHLNDAEMVTRADLAFGVAGEYGFYLQFGKPF